MEPKSVKDAPPDDADARKETWVRERRAAEDAAAEADDASSQSDDASTSSGDTSDGKQSDAGKEGDAPDDPQDGASADPPSSDGDEGGAPREQDRDAPETTSDEGSVSDVAASGSPPEAPSSDATPSDTAPSDDGSGDRRSPSVLSEPPPKPSSERPPLSDPPPKPSSRPPGAIKSTPPPKPASIPPEDDDADRTSAVAMPLVRPRSSPRASPAPPAPVEPVEPVESIIVEERPPLPVPPTGPSISGAHEIEPGKIVDGRYEIESLLGSGAVGLVYRCRHLVLDKTLAIKVLRPDFARDEEVSERLVNEAKAASSVGSPHIVETVDFGRLSDGSAFFVMEYLEGKPLTELVEAKEPTPPEDLLHIAIQVADGLGAAHDKGIIHRDLKPDNVFLVTKEDDPCFVKILDFGIAKLARAERKLTRAGQVYGTPHYMSPEQAGGRDTDPRTDVYAFGIILFELITGQVPFDADEPMAILVQHVSETPPDIRKVAKPGTELVEGMELVVNKCLAKMPEDRYQSMAELRADLERLRTGVAPEAEPPPPPSMPRTSLVPPPERGARGAYVLAALGIIVSAGLGYALYLKGDVIEVHTIAPATTPTAAPVATASPPVTEPSDEQPKGREVMVIVFPADAQIFRGRDQLGKMPVTVNVPEGESILLSIRHPGFASRRLRVDGKRSRVVVGLVRQKKGKQRPTSAEAEAEADKAAQEMAAAELPATGEEKPPAPKPPEAEAAGTPNEPPSDETPTPPEGEGLAPTSGETGGAPAGDPAPPEQQPKPPATAAPEP